PSELIERECPRTLSPISLQSYASSETELNREFGVGSRSLQQRSTCLVLLVELIPIRFSRCSSLRIISILKLVQTEFEHLLHDLTLRLALLTELLRPCDQLTAKLK